MNILFVHVEMPTFARTDYEILSECHDTRAFEFPGVRLGFGPMLGRLPALWQGVKWADLTVSWFGKLHAFFAVLFSQLLSRKSVVVISGGEVCRFSFDNGRYRSLCTRPFAGRFPRYVARHADLLLPVSSYVYHEAIATVGADPNRMRMIPHGFDTSRFQCAARMKKQRMAMTVAEVMDENLYHKGLLDFVRAAELASDISFVLVGPERDGTGDKLRSAAPRNARLTGGLYGDKLVAQMSRAGAYVQASAWESFGCGVAEAMACECVPVVTAIPALREVVGDCGVYLDDPVSPRAIAEGVHAALQHPELGKRARQRIVEKFSIEKRRNALLETLASLPKGHG